MLSFPALQHLGKQVLFMLPGVDLPYLEGWAAPCSKQEILDRLPHPLDLVPTIVEQVCETVFRHSGPTISSITETAWLLKNIIHYQRVKYNFGSKPDTEEGFQLSFSKSCWTPDKKSANFFFYCYLKYNGISFLYFEIFQFLISLYWNAKHANFLLNFLSVIHIFLFGKIITI